MGMFSDKQGIIAKNDLNIIKSDELIPQRKKFPMGKLTKQRALSNFYLI
jgi:hypothetical protein